METDKLKNNILCNRKIEQELTSDLVSIKTYIDSKYIHTICNIEQQEQIINQYSNIRYFRIYTYYIITVISRIKRTSIATIWQNKQMHKLVYIHLY